MSNPQNFQSSTIFCRGGLNSNQNWLYLSATNPGMASELINFEPSLFGGYRRINGFQYLEDEDSGEVAPSTAEGKIYGLAIFANDDIIAARKLQSGATYNFFQYVSGNSWSGYTTGLTLTSTNVDKIRSHNFNFNGTDKIIFVDGVNGATLFDGTNWIDVGTGDTGADFANAGGNQALAAPSLVHVWENHVFMSGDSTNPNVVAHSAPLEEFDWTPAGGAGQINAGFDVVQIYPFRDKLFVFGYDEIKYIYITDSGTFAIKSVTSDIGLQAADSVIEASGDLYFLAPDGIRPISATARIGDFELSSVSKQIQSDIRTLNSLVAGNGVDAVLVREKSQFRYFFSDTATDEEGVYGVIAGLKQYNEGVNWEFGLLQGIKTSCATSGYYGSPLAEYVLHGSHDGKVFRQEQGNSFNGTAIPCLYSTPYFDFGSPSIRKGIKSLGIFTRPEGDTTLDVGVTYDWGIANRLNPDSYSTSSTGMAAIFGVAIFGIDTFGGTTEPTMVTNIQGSGKSVRFTFSNEGTDPSFSIQSLLVEYESFGYK